MKLNVLACCLSLLGTAAFAQKNEWRDPNVNEINRFLPGELQRQGMG